MHLEKSFSTAGHGKVSIARLRQFHAPLAFAVFQHQRTETSHPPLAVPQPHTTAQHIRCCALSNLLWNKGGPHLYLRQGTHGRWKRSLRAVSQFINVLVPKTSLVSKLKRGDNKIGLQTSRLSLAHGIFSTGHSAFPRATASVSLSSPK